MLTWKIVMLAEISVLYIYIYICRLYFLMQIGEIIGNLPNKECEGARGDILMDVGPSTGYLHQVLSPSFSSIRVS